MRKYLLIPCFIVWNRFSCTSGWPILIPQVSKCEVFLFRVAILRGVSALVPRHLATFIRNCTRFIFCGPSASSSNSTELYLMSKDLLLILLHREAIFGRAFGWPNFLKVSASSGWTKRCLVDSLECPYVGASRTRCSSTQGCLGPLV